MSFVIYRILLGVALFALVSAGVLSPHARERMPQARGKQEDVFRRRLNLHG
ncbi:hypothetical protein [Streptomyces sp. CB02923]|uniref:hypothetical protein n=1 Tax=Streptomyces sp. CB02923 TaxID=1718985 RepID=UPI0019023662|nr:hypothetical protein [Streptomyces sp. CB02923]